MLNYRPDVFEFVLVGPEVEVARVNDASAVMRKNVCPSPESVLARMSSNVLVKDICIGKTKGPKQITDRQTELSVLIRHVGNAANYRLYQLLVVYDQPSGHGDELPAARCQFHVL